MKEDRWHKLLPKTRHSGQLVSNRRNAALSKILSTTSIHSVALKGFGSANITLVDLPKNYQMSPMALTSTPKSSSAGKSHAERLTEALTDAYSRRNYVDLTITLRDQVSLTLI